MAATCLLPGGESADDGTKVTRDVDVKLARDTYFRLRVIAKA